MGHGQGLRQLVQGAAAHGAVGALGAAVLFVALSVRWVKEGLGTTQGEPSPLVATLPRAACHSGYVSTVQTTRGILQGKGSAALDS